MVGPVSNEDRAAFLRRAKVGFVLLVGGSAGLITFQGSPGLPVVAGAVVAGLVVGAALTYFAFPDTRRFRDQTGAPKSGSQGHLERRFESENRTEDGRKRRNR
ncbi:hypothetical protein [Halorientalis halophila]|uniref:hypothetical protein n=1 Tax=Halorientalis halophila TaxID=3108499 RepID=UPI00300B7E33